MKGDANSSRRIADMLTKLFMGEPLNRKSLLEVNSKSVVDRDIADIKRVLEDNHSGIVLNFNRSKGEYCFNRSEAFALEEVIFLAKVALESRSLRCDEMDIIINKLLKQLPKEKAKIANESIRNDNTFYAPVTNNKHILERIREFMDYIDDRQVIKFVHKPASSNVVKSYIVTTKGGMIFVNPDKNGFVEYEGLPVAIYFSVFYFYVILYVDQTQGHMVVRLDRFVDVKKVSRKIVVPHVENFEESAMRKHSFLLYHGKPMTITFLSEINPATILDRFPGSKIVEESCDENNWTKYEVVVFESAARMWFLSQGAWVKVLSPQSFKESLREEFKTAFEQYE